MRCTSQGGGEKGKEGGAPIIEGSGVQKKREGAVGFLPILAGTSRYITLHPKLLQFLSQALKLSAS